MEVPRRHDKPDEPGEHDERHDPRLQDLDVVGDRGTPAYGAGTVEGSSLTSPCRRQFAHGVANPRQCAAGPVITGSSS